MKRAPWRCRNDVKQCRDSLLARLHRVISRQEKWLHYSTAEALQNQDASSKLDCILQEHTEHGRFCEALGTFRQMRLEGVMPSRDCFLSVTAACGRLAALEEGKLIHGRIVEAGLDSDGVIRNAIVTMYGKCKSLEDAIGMFSTMQQRDVVSWNAMIAAYAQNGCCIEAIQLFQAMQVQGMGATKVTLVTVLNACANAGALAQGVVVHACSVESQAESDGFVGNAILNMYCKCGSVEDARLVFDRMEKTDVVSCTALIAAYAQQGHCREAINLFQQMQLLGVRPNMVTFLSLLDAYAGPEALRQGKIIDAHIVEMGLDSDAVVGTALLNMYGTCASPEDALNVFNRMVHRDVVSWNAMVAAYAQNGHCEAAIEVFQGMNLEGLKPNEATFSAIVDACASKAALAEGNMIFGWMAEAGVDSNIVVGNALLNMYGKCGDLEALVRIFNSMQVRNVVSWTAVLSAYAQHGDFAPAMQTFRQMQLNGVTADIVTFSTILNVCTSLADGELIHACVRESGFNLDVFLNNALMNMYGKCGNLDEAYSIFSSISERNLVSWAVIIRALGDIRDKRALHLFRSMQLEGILADKFTVVAALNACSSLAALAEGRLIHSQIAERGFMCDLEVGNATVDMYGKCGSLDDAYSAFEAMPEHDVVTWNALISAYARHGHGERALQLFLGMQQAGMRPNQMTFGSVLSAASHAGLVDRGCGYFASMVGEHGIQLTVEHSSSMIDLLGRAGKLDEAEEFINRMGGKANTVVWTALLSSCKMHDDRERGKRAAVRVLELDQHNTAAYVVLSNIYSSTGCKAEILTGQLSFLLIECPRVSNPWTQCSARMRGSNPGS